MSEKIKKLFVGKKLYWYLFFVVVIFLSFIQYYGLVHFKYIVMSGEDAMNHYIMSKPFYDGTGNFWEVLKSGSYPPIYHYSIAHIARLFHVDLLSAITWTAPAILVFSSIAIFILAYSMFGIEAALISFFLYAFIAKTPVQLLKDGAYPNLIDAQIFLPLCLAFIVFAIKSTLPVRRIIFILIAIILAILIPLTHHLATFYFLSIILAALPVLTIVFWVKNKWSLAKGIILTSLNFLFFYLIFIIFIKTDLFTSAKSLLNLVIQFSTTFPFYKLLAQNDKSAIWSLRDYISYNGLYFALFSLLGLLFLPFLWKKNKAILAPLVVTLVWIIVLFAASRFSFYPDRPARDMVVPLSILAGSGTFYLLKYARNFSKIVYYILIAIFIISLSFTLTTRVKTAISYEPMVQSPSVDMEVINYLNKQAPGRVLISTYFFYVPAFLPNWTIGFNYNSVEPDSTLLSYDYLYLQDSKEGFLPGGVPRGLIQEYEQKPFLTQVMHEKSPTNEVYLFKINK